MKLYIFGTCAGTEPMERRQHVSFAVGVNDALYWFDAGEACGRTAHLMGLDLLKIEKIFISHTHMDHVGGLANLLWYIRKLSNVKNNLPSADEIKLFIPNMETWEGIKKILSNTEGGFRIGFNIIASPIQQGLLSEDKNIQVTAIQNSHLEHGALGKGGSFSFGIKSKEKYVVYSGDIGSPQDLDILLDKECDVLMIETGHHKIADICNWANEKPIKNLFFIHNGREILNDIDSAYISIAAFKGNARILEDEDIIEI